MAKTYLISIFCLVVIGLISSCNSAVSQTKISLPAKDKPIAPQPVKAAVPALDDVASLCSQLYKLKRIPYNNQQVAGDPIYDGLINNGEKAIPCLINKITDTTLMIDPREGDPQIDDFRVGDAAVFLLLIISKEDSHPEKMLPAQYVKRWASEGIYTYFAFVENPANRKKIQLWWTNWLKKNSRKVI